MVFCVALIFLSIFSNCLEINFYYHTQAVYVLVDTLI